MTGQNELFGYSPAQGSLFGTGEDRLQTPVRNTLPDPVNVRKRLTALLETARAENAMERT
jgi:hypothetical protein